jgi:two-component sensor histidine kinase
MLLNIVEPFDSLRFLVKNRLLDTVWTKYEEPYAYEHVAKPTDLNHDGSEEIIFSISSGYARQPRRVYAYDIKNDSLWLSPFSGSPVDDLTLFDLDQDGHIEITGWNNAPNNYFDEEIAFSDRNSWFFVFDEKLNYKRTPHKTGPKYSQVRPIPIFNKGVRDYFVYVQGHRDTIPFFDWYRIEHDYSLTKEEFPYKNVFSHSPEFLSSVSNNAEVFYNAYGESVFINESGKEFIRNDLPKRSNPLEIVNAGFGEQEFEYSFLIDGNSRSIAFFSSTGKKLCSINTVSFLSPPVINWIGRINGRYQFCLAGGKAMQWYEVYKNPWRYTQYGIWLLFILGCFGLIHLIRLSQIREFSRQDLLRREILELQLKSVKNQLDPHFAFNALNGLSYLVLKGDTQKVSEFIDNFSELLRTQLQSSDKAVVRLRNEIEFLVNYMALQRIRFDDQIIFKLDIHPDIDTNILVPKTIIQAHVENALKHGLRPKFLKAVTDPGIIKVTILPSKENILIQVEDNGVGRESEINYSEENNGKGLQVLDQIYSAVNQLYKMKVLQHFEDLYDSNGKPSGTRVNIKITYR